MSKLTFDSLNHSRTAGMITVSGKGYLGIAKKMMIEKGVDGLEHDASEGEYIITYNKGFFDRCGIKQLYKAAK